MSSPEASPWLDGDQSRAWLAWIRLQLRLRYEMNRQLQADHQLSLSDWDVMTALSSRGGPTEISVLANQIGWERSRLSHHLNRMASRGVVTRDAEAAPGHVALVRRLFFEGLTDSDLAPLAGLLERIYAHLLEHGTLPPAE